MLKKLFGMTIVTVLGVSAAFSQTQAASKGSANGGTNSSVSKGQKELISSGTVANAELMNSVDVRKSKVGDEVILKTTKAIKMNGETTVAKGATLVGKITEIQQKTKENAQSRIGMLFDRIEGKNLSAPVTITLISMTGLKAAAGNSDTFADTGVMGSSSTSAQSSSSGGLLGGVGNTVGGVGNTVGGLVNTTTQTAGNVVGGVTQTAGNTVGGVTRTVNGIQISQSMGGSASGSTTLTSQNKNMRIEKGVTFNVQFNNSVHN